jgi:hypothetical protein
MGTPLSQAVKSIDENVLSEYKLYFNWYFLPGIKLTFWHKVYGTKLERSAA